MSKIILNLLNDKYFIKYNYLLNLSSNKFNIINNYILYNFILFKDVDTICKYNFNTVIAEQYYGKIILKSKAETLVGGLQYNYLINNKYYKESKNQLLITNSFSTYSNIYNNYKNYTIDSILFNDLNITAKDLDIFYNKYYNNINTNEGITYSSMYPKLYKQFLNALKTSTNTDISSSTIIPTKKYDLITCHYSYIRGLGLTASYAMTLQIPHIISTIAISLKLLATQGVLLLFWSIININIPIIKKLLSILVYGFKNVEIINNDINHNLLIGVPEFYVKCSGYKNNISNDIINELLDIAIDTTENTYNICNILDYYEDYTLKNPSHSLFYNKIDKEEQKYISRKTYILTHKNSSSHYRNSKYRYTYKTKQSSLFNETLFNNLSKTNSKQKTHSKQILPIYYIEDITISYIDSIMQDDELQFKTSIILNKLEVIFVGFFEMVNNLILNSISTNSNGKLYVLENAIRQKDLTNITKIISMFEYNKLPYNKHVLSVITQQKNDIIDMFYSLDNTINISLIKYNDKTSKLLNTQALSNFRLGKSYGFDILNTYFDRIRISYQVKENLLDEFGFNSAPKNIQSAVEDFTRGLSNYINARYHNLPSKVSNAFCKLWEVLEVFGDDIMPKKHNNSNTFRVFHIAEAPGNMILCAKYFAETKRKNQITNYEWRANSLNPFNNENKEVYNKGKIFGDDYGLIKKYYNQWLWGADNTGDITKVSNIKWFSNYIKDKWLQDKLLINNSNKLDFICGDGGLSTDVNEPLLLQKLDLAQVITVLACSSIGGSCCIKHFTPYIKRHLDTYDASGFFIGFLYLYYVCFEEVNLFKPYTSNGNSGEFYVIGKGFKGIENDELDRLYNILDDFKLNNSIIDKQYIPETFLIQVNSFLEKISNLNSLFIEKENLLLTCHKANTNKHLQSRHKLNMINNTLQCNDFLNKDNMDNILIPRFKQWINIYKFV